MARAELKARALHFARYFPRQPQGPGLQPGPYVWLRQFSVRTTTWKEKSHGRVYRGTSSMSRV